MPDYSIIELIENQMPEVTQSIDLTLSRPSSGGGVYLDGMPDPALDPYFPERSYLSEEACFMRFKAYKPTLAYIRGVDGEVPVDRETVDLSMDTIGSLLITKGQVWVEEDFRMVRKIEMLRALQGNGAAAARELIETYTSTPARLTMAWMSTLRMLCQRVAVIGKALYTDSITDIPVEVDYTGRIPAGHIAATKTGNARWSQAATADGIADLVAHLNAVYATIRRFPDAIAMAGTEADNLRNQASTKIKVARFKGNITDGAAIADAANLPRPTLEDIRLLIASELTSSAQSQGAAPALVVTDAIYYTRNKTGVVASAPYLPPGYYSFHWLSNPIEAARFPTATNNFASGLAVVMEVLSKLPRKERLAIDGGAIPIVPDPRYLAARNVEASALS